MTPRFATLLILAGLLTGAFVPESLGQFGDAPVAAPPTDDVAEISPEMERTAIRLRLAEQGITDPAVLVIMESLPKTPSQLLEATSILSNLGYPELAKPMLQQILDAQLNEEQLADLAKTMDSVRMLRLSKQKDLQPQAGELVEAMIAAADRRHRDPDRLRALLPKLLDPSAVVREGALVDLVPGREDSVNVLLHALATAQTPAERAAYTKALVYLGSIAEAPLMGALEASNEAFRADVIAALGLLEVRRAALLIVTPAVMEPNTPVGEAAQSALKVFVGRVPTRAQAAVALEHATEQYMTGPCPLPVNLEGMVTLWHWDEKTQEIFSKDYPADDVGLVLAAQLARELPVLEPENLRYKRLYLSTMLEAAQLRVGYDQALPTGPGSAHDLAQSSSAHELADVLEYALKNEYLGAAAAVARIMGAKGDGAFLVDGSGYPTPLVKAVRFPDRRVRFAALESIMALAPRDPFPGASYVTDALGAIAGSPGNPRVIVGHPSTTQGQILVAQLQTLGYEAEVATNGRRLVEQATTLPDVQFVLVYELIDKPVVREVLYELARDPNTGRMPVEVLSTYDGLEASQRMAAEFPHAIALPRPHTAADLEKDVARLMKITGHNLLTPAEGLAQAKQALAWIGYLADEKRSPYQLQRLIPPVLKAFYFPELAATAAPVLAKLPSAEAQQQMINQATLRTTPIALRRELVKAIDASITRYGVLLTSDQIIDQYNYYNASVVADKDTQEVLGSILDALEKPTKGKVKMMSDE